jgi:hypothetical protein
MESFEKREVEYAFANQPGKTLLEILQYILVGSLTSFATSTITKFSSRHVRAL